jgi:hypothetical protein
VVNASSGVVSDATSGAIDHLVASTTAVVPRRRGLHRALARAVSCTTGEASRTTRGLVADLPALPLWCLSPHAW